CMNELQYFYRTTDGGATWSSYVGSEFDTGMTDLILYSENGLGYATSSGKLWQTDNGGRSWRVITDCEGSDWQEDMHHLGQAFLMPYSVNCQGNGNSGGVRMSLDNGKSWSDYNTGDSMFGTFLNNDSTGWVCGWNKSIYYTDNGGKKWRLRNCGIEGNDSLDDLWFINDTTGWVCGNGVYKFVSNDTIKPEITADRTPPYCLGDTVTLSTTKKYKYYIWSTGETTESITAKQMSGSYWVRAYNSICDSSYSGIIDINYNPKPGVVLSLSNNGSLCDGDSVVIFASSSKPVTYKWSTGIISDTLLIFKSGKYTVTATDSTGCSSEKSIEITFHLNPKPVIEIVGKSNICEGDSTILHVSGNYTSIDWHEETMSSILASNTDTYSVKRDGKYYVRVKNEFGCQGVSDLVDITVRPDTNSFQISFIGSDNEINFDSVKYPNMVCKPVIIYNIKGYPLSIDNLYLFHNIAYSLPQSQFPITIGGGDSAFVDICFAPSKLGSLRDSLLLPDICSDHIIRLQGICIPNIYNSDSRCDVPLILVSKSILNYTFYVSPPVPNPAKGNLSLSFSKFQPDGESFSESCELYNSIGQRLAFAEQQIAAEALNEKGINQSGEFRFDVSSLPKGIYIIIVSCIDGKTAFTCVVE
ncbi:MAG: hypothetical protein QG635_1281, partial [Bacteroidota bacterium]|nr:hypothetical protein [Bacteroidota bacterium]